MAAYKVVMVRHGESAWNKENRFCGWYDADLAESGIEEAKNAGKVSVLTAVKILIFFYSKHIHCIQWLNITDTRCNPVEIFTRL